MTEKPIKLGTIKISGISQEFYYYNSNIRIPVHSNLDYKDFENIDCWDIGDTVLKSPLSSDCELILGWSIDSDLTSTKSWSVFGWIRLHYSKGFEISLTPFTRKLFWKIAVDIL